jgi:hypothetical protein
VFEQRFTANRMACDYLEVYQRLLRARQGLPLEEQVDGR